MGKRRDSSEPEEEAEPFEGSGDDPEFDVEEAKREQSGRRKSSRMSKKPRKTFKEDSASEEEDDPELDESDSEEEVPISRKRKAPAKKGGRASAIKATPKAKKKPLKKVKAEEDEDEEEEENDDENGAEEEDEDNKNGKEVASTDSDSSRGATVTSQVQSRGVHRKFIPKTIFSEDYATGSFVILKKDAHNGADKHPCIWRIDGKALLQKYEAFDENEKVRHKNTSIYTGWSPLDKDLYAPITVDVVRHNNNNLTVEVHWDKLKDIQVDSE